jgi:adenylate cyclase
MRWWAHSRLRTKIFLAFSALILVVLLATLWITQFVINRQVQNTLRQELLTTGQVFQQLLKERAERLRTNSTLLAGDFALKRVVAPLSEYDTETLASVALNYQQRIGVDLLWITDEEGRLRADSSGKLQSGRALDSLSPLTEALKTGEAATAISEVNGTLFQLVAVPVLGPDVIGFLLLGKEINNTLAQQLEKDTGSQVSFLTQTQLFASSWPPLAQEQMFPRGRIPTDLVQKPGHETFLLTLAGERLLSIVVPVEARLPAPLYAVVQRSYDAALAPFYILRRRIAGIGIGALFMTLSLGIGLASGITAPVQTLVVGMREVLRGNLKQRLHMQREDEVGFLARSFDDMVAGLEEKEKIRDVMHKVVSPEIAHELLQRGVTLGGEMREATILFADIRGFTTLSEGMPPPELLSFLNEYFSRISRVIEQEKGVIDKYIGDEVMAIFGAPLPSPDHARRAVAAAVGMLKELEQLNREQQRPMPLRIGIGVATGPVVAGNVGSPERLNYTVLGDTVNVASRLQGLTKEYGVPLVISGATCELVADLFPCRLLGNVAVRGRQQETALYTVEVSI